MSMAKRLAPDGSLEGADSSENRQNETSAVSPAEIAARQDERFSDERLCESRATKRFRQDQNQTQSQSQSQSQSGIENHLDKNPDKTENSISGISPSDLPNIPNVRANLTANLSENVDANLADNLTNNENFDRNAPADDADDADEYSDSASDSDGFMGRGEGATLLLRAMRSTDACHDTEPGLFVDEPSDAFEIKKALRQSPPAFFEKYIIGPQRRPVPDMLAALGFRLPWRLVNNVDGKHLMAALGAAMSHVLVQRERLPQPRTIDDVAAAINAASNIIVLTGAGISTSLGIPDFRSDDGLYAQLSSLGLADSQEVFDIRLFRRDPSIFYSIAHKVLPQGLAFTPTHKFISILNQRGKLLRNYTQNIDNVESYAGVPRDKLVQCHGSFSEAKCFTCGYRLPGEALFDDIRDYKVPTCPLCRDRGAPLADDPSFGVLKPSITFFGESLPTRFDDLLLGSGHGDGDADKCDLLICMGTSLKVAPVSEILKVVGQDVPQIYVSKTLARHCVFDSTFIGPCDDFVELLCQKLGWELHHEMERRPRSMPDTKWPGGELEYDGDGLYHFNEKPTSTPVSPRSVPGQTRPNERPPQPDAARPGCKGNHVNVNVHVSLDSPREYPHTCNVDAPPTTMCGGPQSGSERPAAQYSPSAGSDPLRPAESAPQFMSNPHAPMQAASVSEYTPSLSPLAPASSAPVQPSPVPVQPASSTPLAPASSAPSRLAPFQPMASSAPVQPMASSAPVQHVQPSSSLQVPGSSRPLPAPLPSPQAPVFEPTPSPTPLQAPVSSTPLQAPVSSTPLQAGTPPQAGAHIQTMQAGAPIHSMQAHGVPLQPAGSPPQPAGSPPQPAGYPPQPTGSPLYATGTPQPAVAQPTGAPLQPTATPLQTPIATDIQDPDQTHAAVPIQPSNVAPMQIPGATPPTDHHMQ